MEYKLIEVIGRQQNAKVIFLNNIRLIRSIAALKTHATTENVQYSVDSLTHTDNLVGKQPHDRFST